MDFSSFDPAAKADEGADMTVVHPATGEAFKDKDGKPVTIRVRGMESRVIREIDREFERRVARGLEVDRDEKGMKMLVAATISWSGVYWEGKPLTCTPENARMLYTERDFIGRQVVRFAARSANFLEDAPAN